MNPIDKEFGNKSRNITWIVLKPYETFMKLFDIFRNFDNFEINRELRLEKIFSKEKQIPNLLDFNSLNLDGNDYFSQIETTIQRKINTIGGSFYYKTKRQFNFIFTDNLWLIEKDFIKLGDLFQSEIYYDDYFEKINRWEEIFSIFRQSITAKVSDFSYILNNSLELGRLYSLRVFDPLKKRYSSNLRIFDEHDLSAYLDSFTGGVDYKDIEKASFYTYMRNKEKLDWTIYKNGEIRTNGLSENSIRKLLEIILELKFNKVFYFKRNILDFLKE